MNVNPIFFLKSEINNFEKTTANFSSKSYKTIPINYILLIFNQFTKLNMINVSVCLPIEKE